VKASRIPTVTLFIAVSVMIIIWGSYVLVDGSSSSNEAEGARKSTAKKIIPFEFNLDNTGCGGEVVRLRGEIHFFTFAVLPDEGELQRTTDTDFQVIDALGIKSGKNYRLTNMIINTESRDTGREGPFRPIENISVSFQLNGPEEGDELFARDLKLTIGNTSQISFNDSNVRVICMTDRRL
jgi:hypothetical protein